MKGFKKDGKFIPTEKRNKSSLKKSDVKNNGHKPEFVRDGKPSFFNPADDKKNHENRKKDFEIMSNANKSNQSRSKVSLQGEKGLHRPLRENGKLVTPLTPEQKQENINAITEGTHPVYVEMVEKYPASSVGGDVHRWAEEGSFGNHGHFGDALREGKIADAMYRADSDNLVYLDEIGIEPMLSNTRHHPDDPSEKETFRGRADWAKKYVANGHKNVDE